MYRLIFIIIPFLLSASNLQSQNIFINPGFEEINFCSEFNVPCAPVGWFNRNPADIPKVNGKFIPRSVSGKYNWPVPIENLTNASLRPFVYTVLCCQLSTGKKYRLSFFINTGTVKFHHIDFHFSISEPGMETEGDHGILVRVTPADIVDDVKLGWKAVEKEFIAIGDESFCVAGNFSDSHLPFSEKDVMNSNGNVFYFVDDMRLKAGDGPTCICDDALIVKARDQRSRHTENIYLTEAGQVSGISDTIVLPSVYFSTADSMPLPEMRPVLDSIIDKILQTGFSGIEIIGHTDNTGSEAFNKRLSLQRANSIRDMFIARNQATSQKIVAKGMGNSLPIADNTTLAGRAANRRVQIIVTGRRTIN